MPLQSGFSSSDAGNGSSDTDSYESHLRTISERKTKAGGPVSPISLTRALPSLDDLKPDSPVRVAWTSLLARLETAAETSFPVEGLHNNISENTALQAYLDCYTGDGTFRFDATGATLAFGLPVHKQSPALAACDERFYAGLAFDGALQSVWNVRSELKWHWSPSDRCNDLHQPFLTGTDRTSIPAQPSRSDLCGLLRGKNVLLLGDSATQYLIHDLLLDWTSLHAQTCFGDVYCKEHAICQGFSASASGQLHNPYTSWRNDSRIYGRLPDPPSSASALSQSAKRAAGVVSNSGDFQQKVGILRYRRLDSLFLSNSPTHSRFQVPYNHADTGVRDVNLFALPDVRRADIVILSKSPVPLPSSRGEAKAKRLFKMLEDVHAARTPQDRNLGILALVERAILDVWLPEFAEAYSLIAKSSSGRKQQHIIYRGGWQMHTVCGQDGGPDPVIRGPTLLTEMLQAGQEPSTLHAAFYNIRPVLQNHIARSVGLRIGMPYLDLDTMTNVWRAGRVGNGDCLRLCLPSPGLSLETAFIGGLMRALEWRLARGDNAA